MAEPTNELMMKILISLQEAVAKLSADLGAFKAEFVSFKADTADRFDLVSERIDQLAKSTHEGFAALTVAHRRSENLLRAVDRETVDLKARVVALELRVSELERQD